MNGRFVRESLVKWLWQHVLQHVLSNTLKKVSRMMRPWPDSAMQPGAKMCWWHPIPTPHVQYHCFKALFAMTSPRCHLMQSYSLNGATLRLTGGLSCAEHIWIQSNLSIVSEFIWVNHTFVVEIKKVVLTVEIETLIETKLKSCWHYFVTVDRLH